MSGPYPPLDPNQAGSREHQPAPSREYQPAGSREHQVPQEFIINTGTVGLVTTLARIIAGLTTDKALTLFVAGAFGWMLFSTMQTASQDKANTARLYEDNRERDRQHCDSREDKIARDRDAEMERMRTWFSNQSELQRKFDSTEREKTRIAIEELTRVINKKFPNADEEDLVPFTDRR